MAFKVDKTSYIGDILDYDDSTAEFFLEMGMHCLGCPAARGETLEEACEVHEVDSDLLVEKLNTYISQNK